MPGELGNEELQPWVGYYERRYPQSGGEWMTANYGNVGAFKEWRKRSPLRGMISRIMRRLKDIHRDDTEGDENEPDQEARRDTKPPEEGRG